MGYLLLGFLVCRLGVVVVCVCFTLASLLVFLMRPVAPYCWCVRVIFSSFCVCSVFVVLCVVLVSM